jgi:hypothetical protein
MHPYSHMVLREYQRFHADEDRLEQRRIRDAALDANEVTAERAHQGRLAAAVSRVRARWPRRSPRVSRPMEPSGA